MKILEIKYNDDPILRRIAKRIDIIDISTIILAHDMYDLMKKKGGIGLAANQVGELKRLIVIDIGKNIPLAIVNPIIYDKSIETEEAEEGCLSFPGQKVKKTRAKHIKIKGTSLYKYEIDMEASDLIARIIQHEVDHLDGIVCIDKKNNNKN